MLIRNIKFQEICNIQILDQVFLFSKDEVNSVGASQMVFNSFLSRDYRPETCNRTYILIFLSRADVLCINTYPSSNALYLCGR